MGYKSKYKKYKKKYKKYKSRYKKYKDLRNTWKDKARELESQLMQRDAGTDEWKQDYESQIQNQADQFQQAQMQLTSQIADRDQKIQGFQGQIANFNAANAAREMQERVAADYGNLVGSVGSVSTNRRGENAYRQRWFRRPEALPPGYQQQMTIGDQSTNV